MYSHFIEPKGLPLAIAAGQETPIDREGRPGDETGRIGGQIHGCSSEFFNRSETLHGRAD